MSPPSEERARILALIDELRAALLGAGLPVEGSLAQAMPAQQLVTLDQIAAFCRMSKAGLRRYRARGLPAPTRTGRRGQSHLWDWSAVRPWIAATFHLVVPERFPGFLQ